MIEELDKEIRDICRKLFEEELDPQIARPEEQFGDYTTNIGLRLAGKLGKKPVWIAEEIAGRLEENGAVEEATVAGPGFINIKLKDQTLIKMLEEPLEKPLENKVAAVEFSDPNPFKVLHAGHLYTSVIGESITRLIEAAAAKVHRINYGGDVGLHAAKAIWATIRKLGGENPEKLEAIAKDKRSDWLADCYSEGAKHYAKDKKAVAQINELNKKIYKLHDESDNASNLAKIYWTTRQWSYDYFEDFYEQLGIKFDKYYPESSVYKQGLQKVKQNTPGVFEESDGAIVFKGEKYGLHTRVFVTREGLPTYEAKEVGLAFAKKADYNPDLSIIITANEIMQYMQVVQKSIEKFAPELVKNTRHINHGIVKLPGGVKMSSRSGNILRAVDLIELAEKANKKQNDSNDPLIALGAVKYAFLKNRIGGDTIYNPDESVSLEGNSGPYILYALSRGKSILAKATVKPATNIKNLEPDERKLVKKLSEFSDVYYLALNELAPHYLCTYLFELCQQFNRFYEKHRVIGGERTPLRLKLLEHYRDILEEGLNILGIKSPQRM